MRQLVFDPVIDPILTSVHHMLAVPRRSDGGVGADVLIMAGVCCSMSCWISDPSSVKIDLGPQVAVVTDEKGSKLLCNTLL
jgi:hypothetical protein